MQVETGHRVMVVFVVGILPMIDTKGFALLLLYASSTCAAPMTLVNLILIYTRIKKSYMPTSRTE